MKTFMTALRALILFTIVTGLLYPGLMFLFGRAAFPEKADGSLLREDGKIVGSRLVAQKFESPGYFHPRPSASDYNAMPSGASNLSPASKKLIAAANARRAAGATGGLVFASGSGLDPHIAPADAMAQVSVIAAARAASSGTNERALVFALRTLVRGLTETPDLGFLGQSRINVLELNLALDRVNGEAKQ